MSNSGEDNLIARYFRPLAASNPGSFELLDDAAVLNAGADDIVVTTDAIVEGVHFLATDPPDTIARKALRVNLSDLAAKGAVPAGFVLTLALRAAEDTWLAPFATALGEDALHFQCPLLGGDTVSTPGPTIISITAFGRVRKGAMVRRVGARPGDHVVVTGSIGDAVLGLDLLKGGGSRTIALNPKFSDWLIGRYRIPQPRTALAHAIGEYASAAMDVSDGLAGDLAKLCAAAGLSANIELANVPLSEAARAVLETGATTIEALITGGDDYEILSTVAESNWPALQEAARSSGVSVTKIGTIVPGESAPVFWDRQRRPVRLVRTSFSHF